MDHVDDLQAEVEALLREVLEAQTELRAFISQRIKDPTKAALALHLASESILNQVADVGIYDEYAPRVEAVVDIGEDIVLRSLQDGSYEDTFGTSVELAAIDIVEKSKCRHRDCLDDAEEDVELAEIGREVDPLDLN